MDATVIVVGFVIDMFLKGFPEEAGSLIVILRFWRVFKIIEELSAGASERLDSLREQVDSLRMENVELRTKVESLRKREGSSKRNT